MLTKYTCECGHVCHISNAVKRIACKCGRSSLVVDGATAKNWKGWPLWARTLRRRRRPDEIGVGDTAKRMFAKLGGERFKIWAERLGIPCGCIERQEEWNRRYPY